MKQFLPKVLIAVCGLLAFSMILMKQSDNAQFNLATNTANDFSNHLDTAKEEIRILNSSLISVSSLLTNSELAALVISNQLTEARSTLALQAEKISVFSKEVAAANSDQQASNQKLMDFTNQLTTLKNQIVQTEARLGETNSIVMQLNKDYALLQNRFLRDVAERVIVERRFNSLAEVQAQVKKLQTTGGTWSTVESIYAGLNVTVNSNGVAHVITPE